mmetsp:Transcript_13332/g.9628  ORF Transcript_13332/g.9628 Transcript_13332/m.9628 type:complete len:102 (-) Transcript_13332:336-641(-)
MLIKTTLKKVPSVQSVEYIDDAKFTYFTKNLWHSIYEPLFTVLFVPNYFDFIRLRSFFKSENSRVSMVSEYSTPGQAQKSRHNYDIGENPLFMITERAIVF